MTLASRPGRRSRSRAVSSAPGRYLPDLLRRILCRAGLVHWLGFGVPFRAFLSLAVSRSPIVGLTLQ